MNQSVSHGMSSVFFFYCSHDISTDPWAFCMCETPFFSMRSWYDPIGGNPSYCWWKTSQTTTWEETNLVNHGVIYQPQLAQDFLNHQQYLCPPIEKGNNPSPAVSVNCRSESWDWPTSDRQKNVKPMWITFVWAFENWEWSAREENYCSFNYTSWFVSSYFPTSP